MSQDVTNTRDDGATRCHQMPPDAAAAHRALAGGSDAVSISIPFGIPALLRDRGEVEKVVAIIRILDIEILALALLGSWNGAVAVDDSARCYQCDRDFTHRSAKCFRPASPTLLVALGDCRYSAQYVHPSATNIILEDLW
jgi:hypothetical protein